MLSPERQAEYQAKRAAKKVQKEQLVKQLASVPTIDLDELLNGNPSWEKVQKFFLEEEFDDEHYLVSAIKKHLLTAEQKEKLNQLDLSIADTLNGRYGGRAGEEAEVNRIYKAWNKKLGFQNFSE
jgi:hypothetical protein